MNRSNTQNWNKSTWMVVLPFAHRLEQEASSFCFIYCLPFVHILSHTLSLTHFLSHTFILSILSRESLVCGMKPKSIYEFALRNWCLAVADKSCIPIKSHAYNRMQMSKLFPMFQQEWSININSCLTYRMQNNIKI